MWRQQYTQGQDYTDCPLSSLRDGGGEVKVTEVQTTEHSDLKRIFKWISFAPPPGTFAKSLETILIVT